MHRHRRHSSSGSSSDGGSDSDDDRRGRVPARGLCRRVADRLMGAAFRPVRELFFLVSWTVWLFSSITLGTGQLSIVLYSVIRITISLLLYLVLLVLFRVHALVQFCHTRLVCWAQRHVPRAERIRRKKAALEAATLLVQYQRIALELDRLCGHERWKASVTGPPGECDYKLLRHTSAALMQCRAAADWRGMCLLLSQVLNRQFCNLHSSALYSHTFHGTRHTVESFLGHTVEMLSFLCATDFGPEFRTRDKLRVFQRARRTLGKTVLCLSGGGAMAMYHTGVVRAMVTGNCLPSIINGTSGGAIIAALVGTRTDDELRDPDFLSPSIATRYGPESRWLPTLQQQLDQFIKNRVLMDYRVFSESAKKVMGPWTFEEAYRRTQRELNVTVTWSLRASGKAHPLVLNHISSPSVYVWSAVTASCALPGLMAPQMLWCKGPAGEPVPFSPEGAEVLDGSLRADIPVQRLTELFNAQCFIVSQTNPHVRDLVNDGPEGSGLGDAAAAARSFLGASFATLNGFARMLQSDIAHRLARLSKLKVIPRIYRADFSHVISGNQQYTGDIMIVPKTPFLMRLKALTHPSTDDMEAYIRGGEVACFPKISRIQNTMLLERTLEACVRSLTKQLKSEQARRIRRQHQRQMQQHGDAAATVPAGAAATQPLSLHVDKPVAPAQAQHHSPSLKPGLAAPVVPATAALALPVTPTRRGRNKSGGSSALPLLGSRTGGTGGADNADCLLTPTASILAQLPLHGAVDPTDTEAEAAPLVRATGRTLHSSTSAASGSSSSGGRTPVVGAAASMRDPADSSPLDEEESQSRSGVPRSSGDSGSAAGFSSDEDDEEDDFDVEEHANTELELQPFDAAEAEAEREGEAALGESAPAADVRRSPGATLEQPQLDPSLLVAPLPNVNGEEVAAGQADPL